MWRYDCVAITRSQLPRVASAGVDPRIHLDINLRVDHLLTQLEVHLPSKSSVNLTTARPTANRPTRASLRLQEVSHAIH